MPRVHAIQIGRRRGERGLTFRADPVRHGVFVVKAVDALGALGPTEARTFAERWLPAWTGNDPERLVAFYSDDAFYSDPAIPTGVHGRDPLLAYFRKLLARNPAWIWTHRGSIPLADGFLNEWHASIPAGSTIVEVDGVCTVQLRDGRIYRNQVYFDRSALLTALGSAKSR